MIIWKTEQNSVARDSSTIYNVRVRFQVLTSGIDEGDLFATRQSTATQLICALNDASGYYLSALYSIHSLHNFEIKSTEAPCLIEKQIHTVTNCYINTHFKSS